MRCGREEGTARKERGVQIKHGSYDIAPSNQQSLLHTNCALDDKPGAPSGTVALSRRINISRQPALLTIECLALPDRHTIQQYGARRIRPSRTKR